MAEFDIDAVVIGAGAVGLATGYALAKSGRSVIVLERGPLIGEGVSSRNSEVIHGGLYYPTGSLKARLCVEGRRAMYAFADAHHVPYAKCGKLVVATSTDEHEKLEGILRQAEINGVEGMVALSAEEAMAREPNLFCTAALLSPESGLIDSHSYMVALQGEIEDHGGMVITRTPFARAVPLSGGGFEVHTGGDEPGVISARELVLAAGLSAVEVARRVEGFPEDQLPTAHFGKGNYFAYQGKAPFAHLVYPLPIKGALGTHYRCDLGGQGRFGPDLHYVAKENYEVEVERRPLFIDTIKRFWPSLDPDRLVPDYTGIRPKIHGPDEAQPDYRIEAADTHGIEGLIAMFGIESPGLTASLAIGNHVKSLLNENS